jgi:hypothetical protein
MWTRNISAGIAASVKRAYETGQCYRLQDGVHSSAIDYLQMHEHIDKSNQDTLSSFPSECQGIANSRATLSEPALIPGRSKLNPRPISMKCRQPFQPVSFFFFFVLPSKWMYWTRHIGVLLVVRRRKQEGASSRLCSHGSYTPSFIGRSPSIECQYFFLSKLTPHFKY